MIHIELAKDPFKFDQTQIISPLILVNFRLKSELFEQGILLRRRTVSQNRKILLYLSAYIIKVQPPKVPFGLHIRMFQKNFLTTFNLV